MTSLINNSRKHDMSFHANGRIDISADIARKLSLSPGDVIDIVESGREWLLCVKLRAGQYTGRHEGKVYATHRSHRGSLRTWSRKFARLALSASGQSVCLRCPCGEVVEQDNKKFVTIIYRCAL